MIRRYTVMLLLLGFAGTISVVAQDLQTRHLRMINSGNVSTITAPSSGGAYNFVLPPSNGTLLIATNPSLGTAGVMYSVTGSQDSATPGRWLFNLQYNASPTLQGATAADGGRILSNAFLDANATGLTLTAQAGATSTARGLVASATGGATNYAIEINGGSLKINSLDGLLFGTSGVVSAVTIIPSSVTIPAGQVTGINQYALAVGGATGLASLATGNSGDILVSGGGGANPSFTNPATALGTSVVLYNQTGAQTTAAANGTAYLFNTSYLGAGNTGAGLGGVITSTPTGATNANATGLTINAVPTGTGVAQGIVVNTAAGADLVINEDAITRAGSIAMNVGAGNRISTDGNITADGDLTLGTSAVAGGSIVWNDNTAGASFNGTMQGPTLYTAARTYTLPDADGTFMLSTGALGANRFLYSNASGQVAFTGALSDGMLLIGDGAGAPVAATLSGTRGITITNGAGAITVGMPTGTSNATLRFNGTNWVETGSNFTIDGSGNTVNAGTLNVNGATTLGNGDAGDFLTINTGVAADLTIAEDAITRAGNLAINVGAANTLSTNGNASAAGDLTLGTSAVAGGSIVWNDNTAGASFNGTMQGPTLYTAARTYTLPDADGTFVLSSGALGANRFIYSNASGVVTSTGALSDGMLLIGDGAGAPVAATLSGTRGITITNGAGAITIGMPTAVTTGSVLRYNGTNWVETGATFTVDGSGNTVTQGDATFGTAGSTTGGSLILHDNDGGTAFTASIVGPTTLGSNQTYTLPAIGGTFLTDANGWATTGNGHTVTDGTNNLIGTTTAAPIRLVTGVGGTTRLTISATGDFTFAGTGGTSNVTMTSLSGATFGAALGANEGIVVASSTGVLSKRSVANVIGGATVLYNQTAAQTAAVSNGTSYLYNVAYDGAATGAALGAVITSDAAGGVGNRAATGLTVNSLPAGTGIVQGIVVNTNAVGADLVINEDAITRAGNIAINVGAANTLSTNGNLSADGDLTLGTSAVAGGSIVWNDNTAGASFNGTMQGPTLYTAARTYTLPDADGTFMLSTGALGANRFLYSNASGQVAFTGALSDGMLLIGDGAGAPVAATLSGTRGITITNGAGAITIGMPTAVTTGSVLRYNGTNWVETGATFTVDGSGNTVTQGDATFGTAGSTTGGSLVLHDNDGGTAFTASIVGPTTLASNQTYTLPAVGGTFLTDANGWATTGNGHTVTDGTNNLLGTTTAAPLHLITGGSAAANRRVTITAAGDLQVNYKLILSTPSPAPGAISGAVGGALAISTSFVDQSVTPANTSGAAKSITLPAGTNGQVAYLRISVINAGGNAAINLVNSDASTIEAFAQGADYERVLHMIYKTSGTAKWVVLSNVAP
ncbi:MAG: hypothetical protein JSS89_03415 [Bacteroidetes bacterium]|nr:hypothetical protein [Bacteroidota bacterium]